MREKKNWLILVSKTSQGIHNMEKLLMKMDISYRIVPLPESIKKSCGDSIKIDVGYRNKIEELINEGLILKESLYEVNMY